MRCAYLLLACLSLAFVSAKIFRDPEVTKRIPVHVRESIDSIVRDRLRRTIATHFNDDTDDLFAKFQDLYASQESNVIPHNRFRRDVTNSSSANATDAEYSEWSEFGECSVNCGGGIRVRVRTCLKGNCTQLGSYSESEQCGTLPCVSGTYVLSSISAFTKVPLTGAKTVKFFDIKGQTHFAFITSTNLQIFLWDAFMNSFTLHQTIIVNNGVTFDIMDTYPRIYLVVIEKAVSVFPGIFSRMYYYDPFYTKFQTASPVSFNVYNPSAVKTFDVFGVPHMAVVNYQNQVSAGFQSQTVLICNGETRQLQCADGNIIIRYVFYGRISDWTCSQGVDMSMSLARMAFYNFCVISGVKARVSQMCENKRSCTLTASAAALTNTDTCVQTNKYLQVTYSCARVSYSSTPVFYRWNGIGLSVVSGDNLITSGAKDIEAFTIHSQKYAAVANYINDQNSYHIDSEIYVYNLYSGRFQSLQKIRTDGAIDLEFFKVGEGLSQEYFLAVANHIKVLPNGATTYEVDSVIYKWNWNLFVPFQCIKTYGAMKWNAISGTNGEFILAVTNLYGNTTFYGYAGWKFVKTKVQPEGAIFENAQSINGFLQHNQPMFVIRNTAANSIDNNLYQLNFKKTFPSYELLETALKAVQKINETVYEELVPEVETFNASYQAVKENLVFVDRNYTISDHKTFQNITSTTTFVDLATVETVDLSPADQYLLQRQQAVKTLLQTQSNSVNTANTVLQHVVTVSTPQYINSTKTFANVTVQDLIVGQNVNVGGTVNGVDLSVLQENALHVDENATINHDIMFTDVTFNDITAEGLIDGVNLDDIITTDNHEVIHGVKSFIKADFHADTNKTENINVQGLVNGVNLKDLLTVSTDQNISAPITFNGTVIFTGNLSVLGLVNGFDISELVEETVMLNHRIINITAYKTFEYLRAETLDMKENATINGADNFAGKTVLLSTESVFNDSLIFSSNVTFSHVKILGKCNGELLENVVFIDQPATITGKKTFASDLTFTSDIDVDGTVNGTDISGNVMDTLNNQTITSSKTFQKNTRINGNLYTTSTVDGIDVSVLFGDTVFLNTTQNITGHKIIGNLTTNQINLRQCDGDCTLLNAVRDIKHKTVRKSNDTVTVRGFKTFTNGLQLNDNLMVHGLLNGISLPADLLLQGSNQTLTGENTFVNVTFTNNVTVGHINGVSLTELYEKAWRKSQYSLLTGTKVFLDDSKMHSNLIVNNLIDGVDFDNVVHTFKNTTIPSLKNFSAPMYIHTLDTESITTHALIDGVNLTKLNEELVSLSGDTVVKGVKVFQKHVSFAGNWSIPGLIDGVNITELNNNAMRIDQDQVVTGSKTFARNTQVRSELSVSKLVDGVNLTHLANNAISLDQENITFLNTVTFQNISLIGDLKVFGTINNKNITRLVDDTFMKDGNQTVFGTHHIHNLNTSTVDVSGMVNGLNFSQEVVQLDKNILITGQKSFVNDIFVNKLTTDRINGVDLNQLVNRIVFVNKDADITGHIVLRNALSINGTLTVQHINGVNFTHLVETTLLKYGNQTVIVPTHFDDVTFMRDVTNDAFFNDINMTEFSKNVFYKCYGDNKNITGKFVFNKVIVDGSLVAQNLHVNGTISGIDVGLLSQQVVTRTGVHQIHGEKHVIGSLTVSHINAQRINNFSFPADFVSLSGTETVTAKKTFLDSVTTATDVDMATFRTINTIDLSEFVTNVVTIEGNETIISDVEFQGVTVVSENLDTPNINGVNISENELLVTYGNQTVTGMKSFDNVSTNQDVSSGNHIHGINLKQLKESIVVSGRQNVITGPKVIVGNVQVQGNLETNLVDNTNVTELFSGFNRISNFIERDLVSLNQSIASQKQMIAQLSNSLHTIHQALDYFVEDQTLLLPYKSFSMDVKVNQSKVWLAVGALSDVEGRACSNFTVYVKEAGNFTEYSKIVGNAVTGIKLASLDDQLYIFTSSNKQNTDCLVNTPTDGQYSVSYKLDVPSESFIHLRSIKTSGARHVDLLTQYTAIFTLITNSYNQDECQGQMLMQSNSTHDSLVVAIPKCDVTKSVILSVADESVTIAMLTTNNYAEIYEVFPRNSSFYLLQSIPTYDTSDLLQITLDEGEFLVIANTFDTSQEALAVTYAVPVSVYRFDKNSSRYQHYQDIEVSSATKLKHFKVGVYDYLAIATYTQQIFILRHKGASKWVNEITVPIPGYDSIKDLAVWMESEDVFMSVLADDAWNVDYPTKVRIMKAQLTSSVEGTEVAKKLIE